MIDQTTGKPIDGSPLGLLLTEQARLRGDAPAFTIGAVTTSFADLERLANRRARHLQAFGLKAGDQVVLAMPNRIEFIECAYALWKIGAVPCPVSHRMAQSEFGEVLALSGPACVIGTKAIATGRVSLYDIDAMTPLPASLCDDPMPHAISTPGKILNSGGSTGRPKLIVDPIPSIWGPDKLGRDRHPGMTLLNPSPLYHSAPFNTCTMALAEGTHVICMERFDAGDWLATIEQYLVDYAYVVPTMMSRIARLPEKVTASAELSSIKTLLHMAAPCPPDIKRWWIARLGGGKVVEVYGGTERIGVTSIDGSEWLRHPGSVGKAAVGQEIVIADALGVPLPVGEIGEIHFRKPGGVPQSYAYIGAQDRKRGDTDSFGDMGWLDQDGYLYIADRRTDMVLVGGVNVYPSEIEAAVETIPGVLCCAVIGLPDSDMGNRLHAIVELADGAPEPSDAAVFLQPAADLLSGLKRPRSVEFTRERIRDDTGKVRRSALREARVQSGIQDHGSAGKLG